MFIARRLLAPVANARRIRAAGLCQDWRRRALRALAAPVRIALLGLAPGLAIASTETLDWGTGNFGLEPKQRLAMLVTASVAGRPCQMRIDTGSQVDATLHDTRPTRGKTVDIDVAFAGITKRIAVRPELLKSLDGCAGDGVVVGTLGNGFFDAGTLALDLRNSRVNYTPGSTLGTRLDAQPMFYARWPDSGGHVLVELKRAGVLRGYALLDTGSVPWTFAATAKDQWDWATGNAPLKAAGDVHPISVDAWGRQQACFATKAESPIQAGTWTLAQGAGFCPGLQTQFHSPIRIEGIVGMRSFESAVVTIDYVAGRWLVEKQR